MFQQSLRVVLTDSSNEMIKIFFTLVALVASIESNFEGRGNFGYETTEPFGRGNYLPSISLLIL
jgi:hypothetical protein